MLDFFRFKQFQEYPQLMHAVTTKSSHLPYAFSLALHTGESMVHIVSNRQILKESLETYAHLHFIVAEQTHSDNIQIIRDHKSKGWHRLEDAIEACDALITNVPNVVLTILTADCVPILLYDRKKNVIAAIHAGWKGTKAHILSKTIAKMKEVFDSDVNDIRTGIGPSIGRCCYEVGEEVASHFFDLPQGYTQIKNKYMLDLPYINKVQLLQAGIKDTHIEMSDICTACEVDRFFSYRKEKGCSGRFMSMIGLKDNDENTSLL